MEEYKFYRRLLHWSLCVCFRYHWRSRAPGEHSRNTWRVSNPFKDWWRSEFAHTMKWKSYRNLSGETDFHCQVHVMGIGDNYGVIKFTVNLSSKPHQLTPVWTLENWATLWDSYISS